MSDWFESECKVCVWSSGGADPMMVATDAAMHAKGTGHRVTHAPGVRP